MRERWYLLLDGFGGPTEQPATVLIGVQDIVIANQLRRGVLDAELVTAWEPYNADDPRFDGFMSKGFCPLPKISEKNRRKRELLKLRLPSFEYWRQCVTGELWHDTSFYVDMDWYFAREVERSTREQPSEGLLEYAHASDLSIAEAYEYLKLSFEESADKKLMLACDRRSFCPARSTQHAPPGRSNACERTWRSRSDGHPDICASCGITTGRCANCHRKGIRGSPRGRAPTVRCRSFCATGRTSCVRRY